MDMEGKKENLWEQERYEGVEIPYTLNDVSLKGIIENGQIKTTIPADGVEAVRVSVNTQDMDGIYYINQPAEAQIEKYPDPLSLNPLRITALSLQSCQHWSLPWFSF